MSRALPALPVPAWNTQATYSSIYTPGIHAIDPHSSIATSIHKLVEKVGFGPFGFAPVLPAGLTGGAFPGLFRVGTDEMGRMLRRNLLYTAITRGRELVTVVADPRALQRAVGNAEEGKRWTRLPQRLLRDEPLDRDALIE